MSEPAQTTLTVNPSLAARLCICSSTAVWHPADRSVCPQRAVPADEALRVRRPSGPIGMTSVAIRPQEPGYSAHDPSYSASNAVPKLYTMLEGKDHESPPTTAERDQSNDAAPQPAPLPATSAPKPAKAAAPYYDYEYEYDYKEAAPMSELEKHLAGPKAKSYGAARAAAFAAAWGGEVLPVDENGENSGEVPVATSDLVVVERSAPAAPAGSRAEAYGIAAGMSAAATSAVERAADDASKGSSSADRLKHSRDVCGLGCGINNQHIREAGLCVIS